MAIFNSYVSLQEGPKLWTYTTYFTDLENLQSEKKKQSWNAINQIQMWDNVGVQAEHQQKNSGIHMGHGMGHWVKRWCKHQIESGPRPWYGPPMVGEGLQPRIC